MRERDPSERISFSCFFEGIGYIGVTLSPKKIELTFKGCYVTLRLEYFNSAIFGAVSAKRRSK